MKQAKTIYKVSDANFDTYFKKDFNIAEELEQDITERITEDKAKIWHQQWKDFQDKYDEAKKTFQEKRDQGTLEEAEAQ